MVILESDASSDDSMNKSRTINEIVHGLKLEVDPNASVVELVGGSGENGESILPHVSVQALEYAQAVVASQAAAGTNDEGGRDPLEAVARSSDTL